MRSRTATALPRSHRSDLITEPLRPATTGPPGFEPGPARLELAMLPVTPRTWILGFLTCRSVPYASGTVLCRTARSQEGAERREAAGESPPPVREARERTTRIERASSGWRPVALPSELRPQMRPAGVEPARPPYQSGALH